MLCVSLQVFLVASANLDCFLALKIIDGCIYLKDSRISVCLNKMCCFDNILHAFFLSWAGGKRKVFFLISF